MLIRSGSVKGELERMRKEMDRIWDRFSQEFSTSTLEQDWNPALDLTETEANCLRRGQAVSLLARAHRERVRDLTSGATICAMSAGRPVALARFYRRTHFYWRKEKGS